MTSVLSVAMPAAEHGAATGNWREDVEAGAALPLVRGWAPWEMTRVSEFIHASLAIDPFGVSSLVDREWLRGSIPRPAASSSTEIVDLVSVPPQMPTLRPEREAITIDSDGQWRTLNSRRNFLIDKRFDLGLSQPEEAELQRLQAAADAYLDRIAPLPFEVLERLEQIVECLSDHTGQQEGDEIAPDS